MKVKSPIQIIHRSKKKTSFQDRSKNNAKASYQQTIEQRRRLKVAEYSADESVKKHLKNKGQMLERRIGHLRSRLDSD